MGTYLADFAWSDIDGYKALVNVFYKPRPFEEHLACGCEVEYAERTNMDETQDDTARMSSLLYYNF